MDTLVFLIVVGARLLVPLLIPRFPLPGVVLALLIDGVDQTIFQVFTNLDLAGYQGYDKALDIYYLTIAYISTLRNWANLFAFRVSRFLFYYRLFGVTLFELTYSGTGTRWLLLVFPNTFEYFFIFYEAVRSLWDPLRLTKKRVLTAAAAIWIFIKLPQETWIHILQLDTTDFIKENIFGMPTDTSWSVILQENLWVIPVLIAVAVLLYVLLRWVYRRLPAADWPFKVEADPLPVTVPKVSPESGLMYRLTHSGLLEKIAMVSLVGIIFAQILPDVRSTTLQLAIGTAIVIVLNTVVSHWFALRRRTWKTLFSEFGTMAFVNFGLILLVNLILPGLEGSINLGTTLFFVFLLTLLVTLFDHYLPVYEARLAAAEAEA